MLSLNLFWLRVIKYATALWLLRWYNLVPSCKEIFPLGLAYKTGPCHLHKVHLRYIFALTIAFLCLSKLAFRSFTSSLAYKFKYFWWSFWSVRNKGSLLLRSMQDNVPMLRLWTWFNAVLAFSNGLFQLNYQKLVSFLKKFKSDWLALSTAPTVMWCSGML